MDDYDTAPRGDYDDGYGRDRSRERSRSPRAERGENGSRPRSASPGPRNRTDERDAPPERAEDEGARNPGGSNLFVTGIHPSISDEDLKDLFAAHGAVEECKIMRDPHSKESRGFGFVKMVTSEDAEAAMRGLQGNNYKGRTLAIEVARRSRPRTPTPGKYYGPPKRDDRRGPRGGGRFGGGDRYGDRAYERGPRGGGYGREEYGGGGYRGGSRYGEDRYRRDDYGGGYRGGERGGDRGGDRDRYREERYERRGGGGGGGGSGYYDRPPYDSRDSRGGSYRDDRPPAGGAPSYGGGPDAGRAGGQPYDERPYPR